MTLSFGSIFTLVKASLRDALEDDVFSLSAAIAYYTVFSLPPLLVVLVGVAGLVFGAERVEEMIATQVQGLIGPGASEAVQGMISNAGDVGSGIGSKLLGIGALLFGASGAFGQLQKALNRAWEVEPRGGGGLVGVIAKRFISFGMVVTIGFLLLVSLVVSAVLTAFGDAASGVVGAGLTGALLQVANVLVSFGVITVLFALLFKVLPDADVAWRDVWVGSAVTALLFTIGKGAIGLYLGTADPGSAFGAAGSLALVLVWIYYSALILLVGAEFTQAWAVRQGGGIHADADDTEVDADVHPVALPRDPSPYSSGPSSTG